MAKGTLDDSDVNLFVGKAGGVLAYSRYHERAGVSKKSTLGSVINPKCHPFPETPECYTSVSTNTSGN